jgi:hypothetical protein
MVLSAPPDYQQEAKELPLLRRGDSLHIYTTDCTHQDGMSSHGHVIEPHVATINFGNKFCSHIGVELETKLLGQNADFWLFTKPKYLGNLNIKFRTMFAMKQRIREGATLKRPDSPCVHKDKLQNKQVHVEAPTVTTVVVQSPEPVAIQKTSRKRYHYSMGKYFW